MKIRFDLLICIFFNINLIYYVFLGFLALYCPAILLMIFSNHAFRVFTDKIFAFWELYPTVSFKNDISNSFQIFIYTNILQAILQMLFGTKIYVHGDYLDPEEMCLVVVNHRTRVDWNYLWLCMYHATRKPSYLKKKPENFESVQNGKYHNQNGKIRNYQNNGSLNDCDRFDISKIFDQKLRMKYVLKDEIRHIPGPGKSIFFIKI